MLPINNYEGPANVENIQTSIPDEAKRYQMMLGETDPNADSFSIYLPVVSNETIDTSPSSEVYLSIELDALLGTVGITSGDPSQRIFVAFSDEFKNQLPENRALVIKSALATLNNELEAAKKLSETNSSIPLDDLVKTIFVKEIKIFSLHYDASLGNTAQTEIHYKDSTREVINSVKITFGNILGDNAENYAANEIGPILASVLGSENNYTLLEAVSNIAEWHIFSEGDEKFKLDPNPKLKEELVKRENALWGQSLAGQIGAFTSKHLSKITRSNSPYMQFFQESIAAQVSKAYINTTDIKLTDLFEYLYYVNKAETPPAENKVTKIMEDLYSKELFVKPDFDPTELNQKEFDLAELNGPEREVTVSMDVDDDGKPENVKSTILNLANLFVKDAIKQEIFTVKNVPEEVYSTFIAPDGKRYKVEKYYIRGETDPIVLQIGLVWKGFSTITDEWKLEIEFKRRTIDGAYSDYFYELNIPTLLSAQTNSLISHNLSSEIENISSDQIFATGNSSQNDRNKSTPIGQKQTNADLLLTQNSRAKEERKSWNKKGRA